MADIFTGYPIQLERRQELAEASSPMLLTLGDFDRPEVVDPRSWLQVEDQGRMGSCQGHALTTVCEFAYWVATEGRVIQFSRMFAYLGSQRFDGINGDRGSTLAGGRKLVTQHGLCREQTFPYPSRYQPPSSIPQAAYEEAGNYKIERSTVCRTYDEVLAFIAAGFGGVEIGIAWGSAMTPRGGVIESYSPGGGGHAVAFVGYTRRKDSQGRPYLLLVNSWSKRWGIQGFAEVAPRAVEQMLAHRYTVMIGHTDMKTLDRPRSWDFLKNSMFSKHR